MQLSPEMLIIKLLWLAIFLYAAPCSQAGVFSEPSTLELEVNGYHIEAEIAATQESRILGLMSRYGLPANHGMLFVFPDVQPHCMWMKNTAIPLSAAFLDSDGTIVNIDDMEPNSVEDCCATRPIRYVLEMNRGWFQRSGIGVGARIAGVDKAPAGR